jgi:hypothetical protein
MLCKARSDSETGSFGFPFDIIGILKILKSAIFIDGVCPFEICLPSIWQNNRCQKVFLYFTLSGLLVLTAAVNI